MSNASNLSTLANVLDDGTSGQFLKSTGSGGVAFDTVAAGAVVYATADLLPLSGFAAGDMAYVTATNRFYINNGSGWYSVSLVNTNPNITSVADASSNTTPFTLATDGTATVITVTAADPEEVPLTYGYSVTSGSLNGSTVAQGTGSNSNVFTVTPHASQDATFTITFTASDGINQATSANAFSLSFVTAVADSNHTTLLATATNGTSEFYSLSGALYDSITLDTSSESTGYQTFAFNNDGTKLFRISSTIIYQYTLTTGFDLSTGSYDNVSYTIPSNQGSAARAIQFNNDGTKMYVYTSSNTRISQYALTNGFDLSNVSYDNKLYNGTTGNSGFTFNNDGSKLFKATATSKTIETYNLSEAFNISTASDANVSFSTASQTSNTAFQVQFNSNGTKMFVMDWVNSAGNNIYQYTLTQPYVVSSATYNNVSYNYNSQESSPNDFKFNNNGTKMYIGGFATDRIHQYSTVLHVNSNITDSSSNSHSITVNGDAHAGTFSPHRSGGYSLEFNGSNSRVGIQSSNVQLGTSAFTMEFWLYSNDFSPAISSKYSGSGTNGYFLISATSSSGLRCRTRSTGGTQSYVNSGSGTYNLNEWNHCIFQRDSNGNLTSYLNGTKYTGDNDGSTDITATELGLGVFNYTGYESWFDGYIRDFKLTIGTSALRTASTITVPTEPLTSDSNTTAFLGHLPYLADGSSSPNSVVSSNASTSPFSPYDYLEYSATNHGGSVYFDGSGDSLEIPHSTNVGAFGTNDFTVQLWYYTEAIGSQDYLIDFRQYGANGDYLSISKNGSNKIVVAEGGSNRITGTKNISVGQWFFITVHRDNGSLKLFVNGEQDGSTYSDNTNYVAGSSNNFIIGKNNGSASYLMQGYLSDIKVTHGSALDGTTVPTAPLSSSGTSLHLKGTDASIIDKSQGANLKLVGNTTGSTTQAKFSNTKSMYFDGSGDRATATGVPDLGDEFTIECWSYATASGNKAIVSSVDDVGSGSNNGYWQFGLAGGGSYYNLQINGGTNAHTSTAALYNQWVHLAVTRTNNTVRYFINGTLDSTTFSNSLTLRNPSGIVIGSSPNNTYIYNWTGYIQDLRIANECKYTASFTPPSAPLEG